MRTQSTADPGRSVPRRESVPSGPNTAAATHKVGTPRRAVAIAFPKNCTLNSWRSQLWLEWFGVRWDRRWAAGERGPSCALRDHNEEEWLLATWRILDYNTHPNPADLSWALEHVTGHRENSQTVTLLMRRYKDRYISKDGPDLREHGLRHSPIVLAAAGSPRVYRSQWERRTAEALTRLGVRWDYESDVFDWRSPRNTSHRYTPDFRLLDFSDTYVEVKGPGGADAPDTIKMRCVREQHPYMTLLLWDPFAIEYLEDATDPQAVLDLLRGTALAA